MVILQQDHIEKAKAMVDPAADPDGLFFEEPEIRGGLPGIQDPRLIPLQPVDVLPGQGSDSAHPLHTVQDKPFALQDRVNGRFGDKRFFSVAHDIAVLFVGSETGRRLLYPEDLPGNLHPGEDTVLFDVKDRLSARLRRDTGQGGMIPIAYIFLQGIEHKQLQLLVKFGHDAKVGKKRTRVRSRRAAGMERALLAEALLVHLKS
jgi:hypothetical protein